MSSISLLDIINVVEFPEPNIFLCISAYTADAAAANPKGIKTLLANVILLLVMGLVIY